MSKLARSALLERLEWRVFKKKQSSLFCRVLNFYLYWNISDLILSYKETISLNESKTIAQIYDFEWTL